MILTESQRLATWRRGQLDPVWWVENVLGFPLWSKQREIAHSVLHHRRTAVPSCHGAGKSAVAAAIVLWFLYTHRNSIAATTAPTFRQVRRIVWQEIRSLHAGAPHALGGEPLLTELNLADGWYGFGFSTDDPNAFQGLHPKSGWILVVVDEAAGVDPSMWEAIEGVLSSRHSRLLMIGNPTDPESQFAKECKSVGTNRIAVSAFDTPNLTGEADIPGLVTRQWVEDKAKRWGVESPLYVSRVLGEFPEQGTDTLVPLAWIEAAQSRTLEPGPDDPIRIGLDVARYGDDNTVLARAHGPVLRIVERWAKHSTAETAGRVRRWMRERNLQRVAVDGIGVGAGVVDTLREKQEIDGTVFDPVRVVEVNVGERANDTENYANLRAELFWGLRQRFEEGLIDLSPMDEDLAAQLSSIKWRTDPLGRIRIESKDEMRRRNLPSPDDADAGAIAYADARPEPGSQIFV